MDLLFGLKNRLVNSPLVHAPLHILLYLTQLAKRANVAWPLLDATVQLSLVVVANLVKKIKQALCICLSIQKYNIDIIGVNTILILIIK
jgi:hypothetical protein